MNCKCGCGEEVKMGNVYVLGHNTRIFPPTPRKKKFSRLCLCGCKNMTIPGNRYIHGHNSRRQKPNISGILKANKIRSLMNSKIVFCNYCGNEIRRQFCEIRKTKHYFCNRKCQGLWRSENILGTFHPGWKNAMKKYSCILCGKDFMRHPCNMDEGAKIFCSTVCHDEWRRQNYFGNKCSNWQGGKSYEEYCSAWSDSEYKKDIRSRDDNKCSNPFCTSNDERLVIHHINYEKKDCSPKNLITLCNTCNSKANFNRESWKKFYYQILSEKFDFSYLEGATTIPTGSRVKQLEAQGTLLL